MAKFIQYCHGWDLNPGRQDPELPRAPQCAPCALSASTARSGVLVEGPAPSRSTGFIEGSCPSSLSYGSPAGAAEKVRAGRPLRNHQAILPQARGFRELGRAGGVKVEPMTSLTNWGLLTNSDGVRGGAPETTRDTRSLGSVPNFSPDYVTSHISSAHTDAPDKQATVSTSRLQHGTLTHPRDDTGGQRKEPCGLRRLPSSHQNDMPECVSGPTRYSFNSRSNPRSIHPVLQMGKLRPAKSLVHIPC